MFGRDFIIIDNSEGASIESNITDGYKWATKFSKSAIENPKAKKWIQSYSEEYLPEADLAMAYDGVIDLILKDLKNRLSQDVRRKDVKLVNDIAGIVKKKVELDFKHKGYLRLKDK